MKYIPILKYKETIDIKALNAVKNSDIIPVIELFQEDKAAIEKIDRNRIFYLNVLTENSIDFEKVYETLMDAKESHPFLIPVLDDSIAFADKKSAMKMMKKIRRSFDGLAFKLNGIGDFYMSDTFENLLLMVEDYANTTIILDIDKAYVYSQSQLKERFDNALSIILDIDEDFKNFILAGAIVKISSIGYRDYGEGCEKVENGLLDTVKSLQKSYGRLNISYADYTIDEKHVFTGENIIVTKFYPMIKYTMHDGSVCIYKSPRQNTHEEYRNIANEIIRTNKDYDKNHCLGCKYIWKIAHGEGPGHSTGNASTWKTNMITHHITVMSEILG